jgi:hypothetical protein
MPARRDPETHVNSFSQRHGYSRPEAEISIRHDAPQEIRDAVVSIAYQCGRKPSQLRQVLCAMLFRSPDPGNWSDFPNIDSEVRQLIQDCEWFEIYDFIERLAHDFGHAQEFSNEINRMFRVKGVGWQLVGGQLEIRGPEAFELATRDGQQELSRRGSATAATELHQAILDLSRRPNPEVSGAIQHAMAALECVARDVSMSKDTLGDLLRKSPGLFPKPVDQIVDKAWGYTSNYGRHLTEGQPPQFDEAELVVGLSGVLCRYLSRCFPRR